MHNNTFSGRGEYLAIYRMHQNLTAGALKLTCFAYDFISDVYTWPPALREHLLA